MATFSLTREGSPLWKKEATVKVFKYTTTLNMMMLTRKVGISDSTNTVGEGTFLYIKNTLATPNTT